MKRVVDDTLRGPGHGDDIGDWPEAEPGAEDWIAGTAVLLAVAAVAGAVVFLAMRRRRAAPRPDLPKPDLPTPDLPTPDAARSDGPSPNAPASGSAPAESARIETPR